MLVTHPKAVLTSANASVRFSSLPVIGRVPCHLEHIPAPVHLVGRVVSHGWREIAPDPVGG